MQISFPKLKNLSQTIPLRLLPGEYTLKVFQFYLVKFENLSVISCLGIFGRSAILFIDIYKDLDIHFCFIIRKTSNITTRPAYFLPQKQSLDLS